MAEAGWELPKSRPCRYLGARGPCAAGRRFPAQSQDLVSQEEPASPTPRARHSHTVQKLTLNGAPCLSGSGTSGLRTRWLLPARLHHPEHLSILLGTSRVVSTPIYSRRWARGPSPACGSTASPIRCISRRDFHLSVSAERVSAAFTAVPGHHSYVIIAGGGKDSEK